MTIPSWARVGAKVVCVGTRTYAFCLPGIEYLGGLDGIAEGIVYTIHSVRADVFAKSGVVFVLEEIDRGPDRTGEPAGFDVARFRPVMPSKSLEEDRKLFLDIASSVDTETKIDLLGELLLIYPGV